MFISSFWSKLLIWVLVFFLSLLDPCTFSFISLCIAFTSSSFLWPYSTVLWASWLLVFWTVHLIGWLSLHGLVLFLGFWSVLLFGPYFSVSVHLLRCKGQSLRYLPGWGNPHQCNVVLYVGEGSEGTVLLAQLSVAFSHFPCYPQGNWALLVLIPGWVGFCLF